MSAPDALDDLEPAPTAEELAEAAALREALAGAPGAHSALPLIEALRAGHDPSALDPARHEELMVRAIAAAQPRGQVLAFPGRRWAMIATFAAAACLLLVLGRALRRPSHVALVASRSSQGLFAEPFPAHGGAAERAERIQASRARDLRSNRFAQWGVP